MTLEMSRPFRFGVDRRHDLVMGVHYRFEPPEELGEERGAARSESGSLLQAAPEFVLRRVRILDQRWVYAFRSDSRTSGTSSLFAEYFCNQEGIARIAQATGPDGLEPPRAYDPQLSLPVAENGRTYYYWFVSVPVRLSSRLILRLQQGDFAPYDFSRAAPLRELLRGSGLEDREHGFVLCLPDACDVAKSRQELYAQARTRFIEYGRRDLRLARVFLAKATLSLTRRGDPGGILNELRDSSLGEVRRSLIDDRRQLARQLASIESAAIQLCSWVLDSPEMRFAEAAYRDREADFYDDLVGIIAEVMDGVGESASGRERLRRILDALAARDRQAPVGDPSESATSQESLSDLAIGYLIEQYILPSNAANPLLSGRQGVNLTRRATSLAANALKFFKEFLLREVEGNPESLRLHLVSIANAFSLLRGRHPVLQGWSLQVLERTSNQRERAAYLALIEPERRGFSRAYLVARGILEPVRLVLDTVWAVMNFWDALDTQRSGAARLRSGFTATAAAVQGTAQGARLLGRIGSAGAKGFATAVAVLTFFSEGVGAYEAYSVDDHSVMFGRGVSMLGSGLTILGLFVSASGVGIPVGAALILAGTILGLIGSLISTLSADTSFETFFSHCVFGRNYPSRSTERPLWAGGRLCDFQRYPRRQINAFIDIVHRFTLRAVTAPLDRSVGRHGTVPWLRIDFHQIPDGSYFKICFAGQLSGGGWNTTVVHVLAGTRTAQQLRRGGLVYDSTPLMTVRVAGRAEDAPWAGYTTTREGVLLNEVARGILVQPELPVGGDSLVNLDAEVSYVVGSETAVPFSGPVRIRLMRDPDDVSSTGS